MKNTRMAKILALILVTVMIAVMLCSCGATNVVTFNADNGKTYTLDSKQLDFMLIMAKQNLFINNYWHSAYDNKSNWGQDYQDGMTLDQYYVSSVVSQAESLLVVDYLFDKFNLTLSDEAKDNAKKSAYEDSTMTKGKYKQAYGYTREQNYDYQIRYAKYNAVIDYLYGENGTDVVTEEEKDKYYHDNFTGLQFIVLDMNNDVVLDEEGNKVRETTKDADGNEKEGDSYKMEKIEDTNEKEEKAQLGKLILTKLEEGADFQELAAQYSDEYYSVKFKDGLFVANPESIITIATGASTTGKDEIVNKIKALEIGQHTEELSIGDGEYTLIVKRIELLDKVYDAEAHPEYEEVYGDTYVQTISDEKYEKLVDKYVETFTINKDYVDTLSMVDVHLYKDLVDYYYNLYRTYYGN